MQSPKARSIQLQPATLDVGLPVMQCPETGGIWLDRQQYDTWRSQQPPSDFDPDTLAERLATVEFAPPAEDGKAALCPESGRILIRARVDAPQPFYVERSPESGGIWLDRGEWEVLKQVGLHRQIDRLFSADWQVQLREHSQAERQRTATIDKLGAPLAHKVFELAEELQRHPNGDFGVAYLMQQFDKAR